MAPYRPSRGSAHDVRSVLVLIGLNKIGIFSVRVKSHL